MSGTIFIQVSELELFSLRHTCAVRKHNPFGLTPEEYERGVYLVNGTYESLEKVLGNIRLLTHPMKIKVILEDE